MALTPLTQTQLPQESILDIFGKQNYLGNSFILPDPGTALTDENEDPVLVITNPVGSGKSLFVFNKKFTTDNNNVLVRLYFNPVLNVPGSTTIPVNVRTGSANKSIAKCYFGASITSNGTFVAVIPAISLLINSDLLYIIDQGNSLLITGQQEDSGTTNLYSEIAWYEI
jgi:hypothetical protein